MQRERLFKRLQNFARHALADAILALNLPFIQCSIQPMRCIATDENDQMFLPDLFRLEAFAIYGKKI